MKKPLREGCAWRSKKKSTFGRDYRYFLRLQMDLLSGGCLTASFGRRTGTSCSGSRRWDRCGTSPRRRPRGSALGWAWSGSFCAAGRSDSLVSLAEILGCPTCRRRRGTRRGALLPRWWSSAYRSWTVFMLLPKKSPKYRVLVNWWCSFCRWWSRGALFWSRWCGTAPHRGNIFPGVCGTWGRGSGWDFGSLRRSRGMWMRITPNFIAGMWSRRIAMARLRSCTKFLLFLRRSWHLVSPFGRGGARSFVQRGGKSPKNRHSKFPNFYTFLMNCSRRYARVTINLTVQFLKPCVLKWKKVFRVDWRVLSKPGVTLYCLLWDLRQREIIVLLFLGFLNRNPRWSRPWRHR